MIELFRNSIMNLIPFFMLVGFFAIAYALVSTGVTLMTKLIDRLDRALPDSNRK